MSLLFQRIIDVCLCVPMLYNRNTYLCSTYQYRNDRAIKFLLDVIKLKLSIEINDVICQCV